MKKQSTYSLLVRSEEKARSIIEGAVFAVIMLSSIVSIGQFTAQTVVGLGDAAPAAMVAKATTQPVLARG